MHVKLRAPPDCKAGILQNTAAALQLKIVPGAASGAGASASQLSTQDRKLLAVLAKEKLGERGSLAGCLCIIPLARRPLLTTTFHPLKLNVLAHA